MISVTDHGGTMGAALLQATRIANRVALSDAFVAALAADDYVYIPAGTFEIEFDHETAGSAEVTVVPAVGQTVDLRGAGKALTTIKFYPEVVGGGDNVLNYVVHNSINNTHANFQDFTAIGPQEKHASWTYWDGPAAETGPATPYFYYHSSSTGTNNITVNNVNSTGKWATLFVSSNGYGQITVDNSDLAGLWGCIFSFTNLSHPPVWDGTPNWDADGFPTNVLQEKRVVIRDSVLTSGFDVPLTTGIKGARGISLYVHPCVGTELYRVDCYDNNRDPIKQFSAGAVIGVAPSISYYEDVRFFNCNGPLIQTHGEENGAPTIIKNCTADAGILLLRNETRILGGAFHNGGISGPPAGGEFTDPIPVTVTGTAFSADAAGAVMAKTVAEMEILFDACSFDFQSGCSDTTTGIAIGDGTVTIRDTTFTGLGVGRALDIADATVTLDDSTVRDLKYGAFMGPMAAGDGLTYVLALNGNTFHDDVGNMLAVHLNLTGILNITGGNNNFSAGDYEATVNDGSNRQRLSLREATNPAAVASASTVNLSKSYRRHRVSGTTQINTIALQNVGSGVAFDQALLQIERLAALAFGSSGNIVPLSAGEAREGVATFRYDAVTAKWNQIVARVVEGPRTGAVRFVSAVEHDVELEAA